METVLDLIERKAQVGDREVYVAEVQGAYRTSNETALNLMLAAVRLGLLDMEVQAGGVMRFTIPEKIGWRDLSPVDAIRLFRNLVGRPDGMPGQETLSEAEVTRAVQKHTGNQQEYSRPTFERLSLKLFVGEQSAAPHGGFDLGGLAAFPFDGGTPLGKVVEHAQRLGFAPVEVPTDRFLAMIPLLPQHGFEQAGIELDPELDDDDENQYFTDCILRARKGQTEDLVRFLKDLDGVTIRSMSFLEVSGRAATGKVTLYSKGILYTNGAPGLLGRLEPILAVLTK